MISFFRRRRVDRAELIRADTFWLSVRDPDKPVPFWPADFPQEMETELPYRPSLAVIDRDDVDD